MTQDEVKKLKVDDPVGFQASPEAEIIDGKVILHGPRTDSDGRPYRLSGDVLTIELGDGMRISWEPESFSDGITQLVSIDASN